MSYKQRLREIAKLREKHKYSPHKVPLPDLKVESNNVPSLSETGIDKIEDNYTGVPKPKPEGLLVGNSHKQGNMVMFKSELPWSGGKKS